MARLKSVFVAITMLLSILVVLVFILENQQSVSLLFLGWTGPQLPVSIIAVVAFLIGMIVGPFTYWLCAGLARARRNRLG